MGRELTLDALTSHLHVAATDAAHDLVAAPRESMTQCGPFHAESRTTRRSVARSAFITRTITTMNHASLSPSFTDDSNDPQELDGPVGRVTIDAGGRWIERTGEPRVAVARRPVLSRILAALAAAHAEDRWVTLDDLVLAGWPGERMRPAAAKNRLHVALSRLRDLGLRGTLEQAAEGYRLRVETRVRRGD